ncbi:MAG: enoyl-CoA hydratase/isomerase family protein [Candidatus Krumholzibacteriota bacterium]|nr:enoyl-CoA hydratase/isomerase family protein [Candidatus Krumholzibacteriota bacterium]
MGYQCITVEKKDWLARVAINRPDKLNALSIKTVMELTEAFTGIRSDDSISVVILEGAGGKAFAAGADLNELSKQDMLDGKEYSARGHRLCNLIEFLEKPVIASICGFALGGGCEIAMACTLRIASEKARLGQPEINLGTIPGFGGTQRLARLIPRGIAMELVLTGRVLKADEALALGLLNRVVPDGELESAVLEMADTLAAKPPFALRANMEAVLHGSEVSFEEGCRIETNLFALTCGTEDMKEGTLAFLEKRKAEFTGR